MSLKALAARTIVTGIPGTSLDEDARQQSEPETRYGRVNRGNQ